MNCAHWEERIALYMGGDLRADESADVERHLAVCAGCQVFASGIRESLGLLREAHAEQLDAAAFAAVRARVLGELERRPAQRWWFVLGTAFAVAALLLAVVWVRPAKHQAPPPATMASRETPRPLAIPMPAERRAAPVVHRRRAVRKPAVSVREAAVRREKTPEQPLVVKMMTNDPDVVIYWITNTQGEMR